MFKEKSKEEHGSNNEVSTAAVLVKVTVTVEVVKPVVGLEVVANDAEKVGDLAG